MSPKFIILHRFDHQFKLTGDRDNINEPGTLMVNPRRVDYFEPIPPPANPNQSRLFCGTRVNLGSKQFVIVQETVEEIRKMLKK